MTTFLLKKKLYYGNLWSHIRVFPLLNRKKHYDNISLEEFMDNAYKLLIKILS